MNKKYIFGLLVIILVGGTYGGYEYLTDDNSKGGTTSDFTHVIVDTISTSSVDEISICSFNIQFLGHFKRKDNEALADLVENFDIVVIQELVTPPYDGTYPNDEAYTFDKEAQEFFDTMTERGFNYVLSEEDTGPGEDIHKKTSATEWWVAFYNDEKVDYATDLPNGFIADDRSKNNHYDRVPYAFPFRSNNNPEIDFILISVHLAPGASANNKREEELFGIAEWIDINDENEKDFILLGDMRIEDSEELQAITPEGFVSLYDECIRTNILLNKKPGNGAKTYDHIMYRSGFTSDEADEELGMVVLDIIDVMEGSWELEDPYPVEPYDNNLFKQFYSDHNATIIENVAALLTLEEEIPHLGQTCTAGCEYSEELWALCVMCNSPNEPEEDCDFLFFNKMIGTRGACGGGGGIN